MKFIKRICSLVLVLFATLSLSCCFGPRENDVSTFDDFTKSIFNTILNGDELTINYYFEKPEDFGISHSEPSLSLPSVSSALNKVILNLYFGEIKNYNYDKLNFDQKMTYNVIVNLLDNINKQTSEMSYLSNNYLGSYLGYQAQLPILLMRYNLRNKLDVDNYFILLDKVPETFKSYVDFEIEKADKGYGMPDFVIDKVIAQCESFLSNINNDQELHFMITSMNNRIDELDFLSDEQKMAYKAKNILKVRGPLAAGYQYIIDNLEVVRGKSTNDQGLAYYVTSDGYEIGKEFYQIKFQSTTGYDDTLPEAINYLDQKINEYIIQLGDFRRYVQNNPDFLTKVADAQLMSGTVEEQMDYYLQSIEGYYPAIPNTFKINIEYVEPEMEDFYSPAAYIVSAIDNKTNEFIYLNRSQIYIDVLNTDTNEIESVPNYNYLATVSAHEGIPGHLYQNVYFKNQDVNVLRKVLKSIGYTEGWAVYAEHFAYELFKQDPNIAIDDKVIDFLIFQDDFTSALQARVDMGIHYEGWDIDRTYQFLSQYLNTTYERVVSIYQQLVEVPTNSQSYIYTYLKIADLYEDMQQLAGADFSILEFNTLILDCGPVPLKYVDSYIREYYQSRYSK